MRLRETGIAGCFELQPDVRRDERGFFVKTFHQESFEDLGLETNFPEEFYSHSSRGVLRGLHFAVPPMDQVKIVNCVHGSIMDVIVDLRRGSASYLDHIVLELNAEKANMVYVDRGLAHGFYVLSPEAVVCYRVSTQYSPEHDQGVKWDSAGIAWPDQAPIVSQRDTGFPSVADFETPFVFTAG